MDLTYMCGEIFSIDGSEVARVDPLRYREL